MIKLQEKNGEVDLSRKKIKGDPGGYYKPAVDAEGTLTWTPSDEDMEPVEEANIKGPAGERGADGKPGKDTVWVGDTEPTEDYNVWIAPGSSASDLWEYPTQIKNDLRLFQGLTILPIKNDLEVY